MALYMGELILVLQLWKYPIKILYADLLGQFG